MASPTRVAALVLAMAAILGVLAQMHGAITTDGINLLFFSPDPLGSLFFNNVDIVNEMNELKVCAVVCRCACSHLVKALVASTEAIADRLEV